MKTLEINRKRLLADLSALGSIGADGDKGIYRSAFSDAEMQAREWFKRRVEAAGLMVHVDGAANMCVRLNLSKSGVESVPVVATGSHLDTVPGGGYLDGALGVIAGLEALRCLKESGREYAAPFELIVFTDEEGAFSGMFGSQAITGQLTSEQQLKMKNAQGQSINEAMRARGLDPELAQAASRLPETVAAFIELHIEQGPVLEKTGHRIGVVEGIAGQLKWIVSFFGRANHAGTTPMNMRADALLGIAALALAVEEIIATAGSSASVATVGYVQILPNATNVIPGQAQCSLDIRDVDNATLQRLSSAFKGRIADIAQARNLSCEINELISIDGVACEKSVQNCIEDVCERLGVATLSMPSGAVHDAQMMASITRTGMIFIPSIGGLSHSALERSDIEDVVLGAKVLLNTLAALASE